MATTTIISSEVDSPSTWLRPTKTVSAGTKRTPPPTPTRPPVIPPARQISTAASSLTSVAGRQPSRQPSRQNQLHRDRDQQQGEEVGDGALGDALLDRGAEDDAERGGDRERQCRGDVDVAVEAALGEGAEKADDDDRGEAGAGGEALAVGEPEDQQRHDDRPSPDPEEAAEEPGEGADCRQLEEGVVRALAGGHPAILRAVPPDSVTSGAPGGSDWTAALAPLRAEPGRAAILTDVDGTLAPIVERAEDAAVPAAAREALAALGKRYALVGCISGRRAKEARRLVGLGALAYAGNHGLEVLMPGDEEPRPDASVAGREQEAAGFLGRIDGRLEAAGLRREDKGPIQALHWRGSVDEAAAEGRAREIAIEAGRAGLEPRWGRKVLELRPAGGGGKDAAVAALLSGEDIDAAAFAGDDRTDLDAFRRVGELREQGELEAVLCVGVISPEAPPALTEECDLAVDGPDGWVSLLEELAA